MADLIATLAAAAGAAGEAAGYQISRSLRFNSADSAYLSRTPASAGTRTKWTLSFWIKRNKLGSVQSLITNDNSSGQAGLYFQFWSTDLLVVGDYNAGFQWRVETNRVFRDPSSWFHIVVAFDSTQATSTDRAKLYINGVQETSLGYNTQPSLNYNSYWNNSQASAIGRSGFGGGSQYLDAQITEIHNVDGQALTPSDFGETDETTGVWKPKAYAGTYGTNGFYLNFSDNTSGTTLGYDYSGNSNNWTTNNISVSAGAGNDSLVDTPTPYGTDQGLGGEVRGNYATWNPLDSSASSWLKNGNLDSPYAPTAWANAKSTLSMSSGKWYFEATMLETWIYGMIGVWTTSVQLPSLSATNYLGGFASGWVYQTNGVIWNNNVSSTSGILSVASGDIVNIAVDADAGKIWFGKNGTWFNSGDPAAGTNAAYSNLASEVSAAVGIYNAASGMATNFGQRPFAYTAPSGFKALCTQNLPDPTVVQGGDYFNTVLYTGNGSTQSITGVGFAPDWVWLKARSAAYNHELYDTVRGALQYISSSTTNAESTLANSLTAFGSDGFSVGSQVGSNGSGTTFVAWNWNAGGSNATNTDGTITSTVRANPTAGFSIVSYTGTLSSSPNPAPTVGHGLGVAPSLIISKSRNNSGIDSGAWYVNHAYNYNNYYRLNTTAAGADISANGGGTEADPTSTVFSTYYLSGSNISGNNYIAYCFAEVEGFSKFGSYTGNGSANGPFTYTGFRPAFVIIKRTDTTDNWLVFDNKRDGYNVNNDQLYPNSNAAEVDGQANNFIDLISNGFKCRNTAVDKNASGGTYIYMAFAENPFKYSLAR